MKKTNTSKKTKANIETDKQYAKRVSKIKEPAIDPLEIHELKMRIENLEDKLNKISSQIGNFYHYDIREIKDNLDKAMGRLGL
jgi:molecular chaperone GrpE (heat shock protein)